MKLRSELFVKKSSKPSCDRVSLMDEFMVKRLREGECLWIYH